MSFTLQEKVKGYIRLIRFHTIIASGLAPVLGACASYAVLEDGWMISQSKLLVLVNLFFVGAMIHIFGQTLNDYADYNVDRKNPELADKPLVSGAVSKSASLTLMVISFILIWVVAFPLLDNGLILGMLIMVGFCGVLYDFMSKHFVHAPLLLGGWAFFLGVFGGVAASDIGKLANIPLLVIIISLLGGLQMWMNTAILGHLKDIKNDAECGVNTFPVALGVCVRAVGDPPKLIIPHRFRVMVLGIQVANLALAFVPLVFFGFFYVPAQLFHVLVITVALILLSIMIMLSQYKILWTDRFERGKLMRIMSIREVSAYFLVIVLVYPMTGPVLAIIFLFLPLVWFVLVNFLFTKNPMQPAI